MNSKTEDVEKGAAVDLEKAALELTRLTTELQRAGSRRTSRALISILIPAILGLAWLGYTGTRVQELEQRAEKARGKIIAAELDLNRVQQEKAQKEAELEVTKQQVEAAKQELEKAKTLVQGQLATVRTDVGGDPSAVKAVTSAEKSIEKTFDNARDSIALRDLVEDNRVARLFFFAVDKQQKEKVRAAISAIESKAPFARVLNVFAFEGRRDKDVQVRYFRDVDAVEAGKILEALKETILAPNVPARISRVNDPNSVGTGRKFQVWLTSNALE